MISLISSYPKHAGIPGRQVSVVEKNRQDVEGWSAFSGSDECPSPTVQGDQQEMRQVATAFFDRHFRRAAGSLHALQQHEE